MDKHITGVFHRATGSDVRTLIKWTSPVAINDGYSAMQRGGTFCNSPVFVTDAAGNWAGTWASNTLASTITTAQLLKIAAMQVADECTVQEKLNWLLYYGGGDWGAPMRGKYVDSSHWMNATSIQMIATVYAGQAVEVIGHGSYKDMAGNVVPMSEIRTFDNSNDWNNPGAWQYVTVVNQYNNPYMRPQGLVKLPIYFGGRRAWVLDRWLEV